MLQKKKKKKNFDHGSSLDNGDKVLNFLHLFLKVYG